MRKAVYRIRVKKTECEYGIQNAKFKCLIHKTEYRTLNKEFRIQDKEHSS